MKAIKVQTWILLFIILLQIGAMFFWLGKREGVHVDEMYSLESAHYLRSGVTRMTELDGWYGSWHSAEEFDRHFTVSGDESFWSAPFRDKVYMMGKISPYKILLNITLSVTEGEFSFLLPVLLNVVFFAFTQLLLYRMTDFVIDNKWNALLAPLFFGFSAGAVNMVLYIRMYAMIMFFSALLVWLYILLIREDKLCIRTAFIYAGILVTGYFSFLCHQYTVLLIASLIAAYCIIQVANKKWRRAFVHIALWGILGSVYIIISGKWRQFVYGGEESRAKEAIEILQERNVVEWMEYLQNYWKIYLENALGGAAVFLVIAVVILMAISYRKGKEGRLWLPWTEREKQVLLLTVIAVASYHIIVSRIAPTYQTRYISYLFPMGALIISILAAHFLSDIPRKRYWESICCLVFVMVILNGNGGYIENLYPEIIPIKTILAEEENQVDNIYVNSVEPDSLRRHQMYRDGYLWREGLRYYVTTSEMLEEQNAPGIGEWSGSTAILWVDKDEDTYEILDNLYPLTGFNTHEKLGYTQESKVYRLTRQ